MSGMSGGSMLRTRRKDANVKPNRRLDRKSSRGMIYENEELRLRTININAEVERGQTDIKKLKRENEQLRREVGAIRGEYDRLERLLRSRHQNPSDHNSDAEASDSCCSGCESECCNVQNDVNTACDTFAGPQLHGVDGCCGGAGRGGLTAVPEETGARTPPNTGTVHQSCGSCNQQSPPSTTFLTPCELKPDNCGFSTMDSPNKEYFKAVVTVPLSSHLPETPCICLTPSAIIPKTGLDVLINNNHSFENFEGLSIAPPIGFIIPQIQTSDDDSYQIVPNVEISGVDRNEAMTSSDDVSSSNTVRCLVPISNELSPLPKSKQFANGGNIEDLLGDMESLASSGPEYLKDSYFVCKTKKVIQQLTTVQNTTNINNIISGGGNCGCNCGCKTNNVMENRSPPDVVIIDSSIENMGPQFYRTEKNIELNYDYPKAFLDNANEDPQPIIEECAETAEGDAVRSVDMTQTTHTTTEVNSTVMMFERKKIIPKSKSKFPFFVRSHSAPIEPISDEPIYATIKKIPKKLKRLNIRNLENEIKYIPPSEVKEDTTKRLNNEQIVGTSESDSQEIIPKINGQLKIESLSESSDRINAKHDCNVIPKSPSSRKKKRFSIYFKRKNSSKSKLKFDAAIVDPAKSEECGKLLTVQINNGDADKLLEMSSSLDSPDGLRFKDTPPTFTNNNCKRHRKSKHHGTSRDSKNHVPSRKCSCGGKVQHGEECEDKIRFGECSGGFCKVHHNKGCSLKKEHSHHRNGHSPSRHNFKHDSYQEMTTSHSERERTNSLSSSGHSGFSLSTTKHTPSTRREGSIPWCGCWGNSCI